MKQNYTTFEIRMIMMDGEDCIRTSGDFVADDIFPELSEAVVIFNED